MDRMRVVINRLQSDLMWECIEIFLKKITNIDVYSVESDSTLNHVLCSINPHVLIVDGNKNSQIETNYQSYLEQFPEIGIIVIAPDSREAIIGLQDIGCGVLLRLIRMIATQKRETGSKKSYCVQYLTLSEIERLMSKPFGLRFFPNCYQSSQAHLRDILEWIDLSLHLTLFRSFSEDYEVNTPGWAMSAGKARSLLGENYANTNEEELIRLLEDLEKKIKKFELANSHVVGKSKYAVLFDAFGLNEVERKIVLFTLAPELDGRYARIFGYLNDDLTRRRPTPSILTQLVYSEEKLAWDIQQLLNGDGSLATYQVVMAEPNDNLPGSEVGLKLAPDILTYLLSETEFPPSYDSKLEILCPNTSTEPSINENSTLDNCELRNRLYCWKSVKLENSRPIIQILGSEAALRWFGRTAIEIGESVVILNLSGFRDINENLQLEDFLGAARVSLLYGAILVVTGMAHQQNRNSWQFVGKFLSQLIPLVSRVAVHSDDTLLLPVMQEIWQVEHKLPDFHSRATLWQEHARMAGIELSDSEALSLAGTVRFDKPEINATLSLCIDKSNEANGLASIKDAARRVARSKIPSLIRRIEPVFGWKDIILPGITLTMLKQISGHIHHSGEVFDDWGFHSRFPNGCGVAALFSGPSGTGKTMAAQIIARDLGVELFQIDLANTVSKYIGETEKNLENIFNAAEHASAVLLFDEADALFGKRTEVKDAHDRYANVEVAYLLQRLEAYSGLAILTTNFKQNIDNSFVRRLRFVIDFPAPSAVHREAIWRCVFPSEVDFASDVDTTFLARRFELTGGHIQQIAVRAAFAAVAEKGPIAMKHIVQATREELAKLGMINAARTLTDAAPMIVSETP